MTSVLQTADKGEGERRTRALSSLEHGRLGLSGVVEGKILNMLSIVTRCFIIRLRVKKLVDAGRDISFRLA